MARQAGSVPSQLTSDIAPPRHARWGGGELKRSAPPRARLGD